MRITLPDPSLVVLLGASGSGKSTFARKHFKPTEVLSSDHGRALAPDGEVDQGASAQAVEVLHLLVAKRLELGKLTVVDATNVQSQARKPLVELAKRFHCLPVAVVLDVPERVCRERNAVRPERDLGPHVVSGHVQQVRRSLDGLEREGFRCVHVLRGAAQVEAVEVERRPLWCNRKQEMGPFDVLGDVHGCGAELHTLLERLGYQDVTAADGSTHRAHPTRRKAVFVGDLVDRGPDVPGVLRTVMAMVRQGSALCVPGNHDTKLVRCLRGRAVKRTHGLAQSMEQLEREPPEFVKEVERFLDDLGSHLVLDGGNLVVAHAGMREDLQGRDSGRVREFALYGATTGAMDELGLPVRIDWAAGYRGKAMVVYGHTPVAAPAWVNNTVCVDTGCVFGGHLTALRYPEKELVSVPAARVYCEPGRPLRQDGNVRSAQDDADEVLELQAGGCAGSGGPGAPGSAANPVPGSRVRRGRAVAGE